MKQTDTDTLVQALRILARDIESEDGVANETIREAADRIETLEEECKRLRGRKCAKCGGGGMVQRWTGEYVECDACNARGFGL
jgi:hypothetical protein